jgi:hypothetical protein
MADYFAEKGAKICHKSACKLKFHSAKLRIKRSVLVDLSEYYTIQSKYNPEAKYSRIEI